MLGQVKEFKILSKDKQYYLSKSEDTKGNILIDRIDNSYKIGDTIKAFIYDFKDGSYYGSSQEAKIKLGEIKALKVVSVVKSGIFLDWGLPSDLFMPYTNTNIVPEEGRTYLVKLAISKKRRLVASMDIKDLLKDTSTYVTNDWVDGRVYSISSDYGAFVAVDNIYDALISKDDLNKDLEIGDLVHARVISKNKDGKLNLSLRDKSYLTISRDARLILEKLKNNGGYLAYGDKSDPQAIKKEFSMSKSSFKKAIGLLYKKRLITMTKHSIKLTED